MKPLNQKSSQLEVERPKIKLKKSKKNKNALKNLKKTTS